MAEGPTEYMPCLGSVPHQLTSSALQTGKFCELLAYSTRSGGNGRVMMFDGLGCCEVGIEHAPPPKPPREQARISHHPWPSPSA
jgi:hypothetical protein